MLAVEVKASCLLGLMHAHPRQYYILTSAGPWKEIFLQHDFSSVKIPTRFFKTLSKCLSSLVLKLLVCLCPKVEYDVTNDNSIQMQGPIWINFDANEQSHCIKV